MTNSVSGYQNSVKLLGRTYTISTQTILILLIAMAVGLRVAVSLFHGNTVSVLPGIYDQVSYDNLARRVLSGYGFTFAEPHWPLTRAGEPTAHWSFLYTFFLAGVYGLFGPHPLIARLLQAMLVGGLQTFITYRIGEKIFSKNVGLVSAAITAFYIYFIYYSGALMTEPFYITAILSTLFLAMKIADNPSRQQEIALGLILGISVSITVLFRQLFLLFLPFLYLWIWFARYKRGLSLPVISTILSLLLVFLSILPFTLYNQFRFGRFVLLNTNSGYAFFWGNHPVYGTRFIPILPEELGSYQSLIPADVRSLDEAALDQELLKQGLRFVIDDPKRYLLLSISRIPTYFMFWPSSGSSPISNISRVASFGITFPFMIYGLILVIKSTWGKKGIFFLNLFSSFEGLLILFALVYTAIHLLTWALIRYRLPVDAVLITFAALAIYRLFQSRPAKARMAVADQTLKRK
jgi:4-amino-4-deoxy-L-arabinose transferase-like glycosyltransferase